MRLLQNLQFLQEEQIFTFLKSISVSESKNQKDIIVMIKISNAVIKKAIKIGFIEYYIVINTPKFVKKLQNYKLYSIILYV